ncbi:hypothetical protein [Arhodomonas sp. AD133]|uniref:hypothetical protein n=1 Tax=Arhodomonas sp. AD133 TaxID=3415009 RepID=UPI003EBCFB45
MPKQVGVNGEARDVVGHYVGAGGAWRPMRYHLVGVDGHWRLADTTDVTAATAPSIQAVSVYGGTPNQELRLQGDGLDALYAPQPATGAFYALDGGLGDDFQNFVAVQTAVSPVYVPSGRRQRLALPPGAGQYVQTATDTGGYTLLGLTGSDGLASYTLGLKASLDALPPAGEVRWLLYAGQPAAWLGVRVTSAGAVEYVRYSDGLEAVVAVDDGIVAAGEDVGVIVDYDGDAGTMGLYLGDGQSATSSGRVPPVVGTATDSVYAGRGVAMMLAAAQAQPLFNTETAASAWSILESGRRIQKDDDAYGAATAGDLVQPGTGTYYVELEHFQSFNVQFGVAPVAIDRTLPPGVIGWCVATINGRRFAQETGGGTPWSGDGAIPAGARIGVLYDSDDGTWELFVDGVSRGSPFAAGTITEPVRIIAGSGGDSGTDANDIRVNGQRDQWAFPPAGTVAEFPGWRKPTAGATTFTEGALYNLAIRSALMSADNRQRFLNMTPSGVTPIVRDRGGMETDASAYTLAQRLAGAFEPLPAADAPASDLIMTVPDVAPGNYELFVRNELGDSNSTLLTVQPPRPVGGFELDFGALDEAAFRTHWMAAHTQWGGDNGGVSRENVILDRAAGLLRLRALGDDYTGAVQGVDADGEPSGVNTRIGGCLVSRGYLGPGRIEVECQLPPQTGVASALWTFHYEEGYPGHPLYDAIKADAIHDSGSASAGYVAIRNHEIDMEFPTALKTASGPYDGIALTHGRFNTWHGELRNWSVPNNDVPQWDSNYSATNDPAYWSEYTDHWLDHGINLADGGWHTIGFEWHTDPDDPRVAFFIDGTWTHTIRTHVPDIIGRLWLGLWFPSGAYAWAGETAPWIEQEMLVRRIAYTPFDEPARELGESYPHSEFRDIPGSV